MLTKNANCYNIDENFKYSTVISTFSEYITIFRTLSIDIWQLKCQWRQTKQILQKMANFSELLNFSSSSFLGDPLWNQKLLLLTATARHYCYTVGRPFPTLSCFLFFHKFFGTNFRHQYENNVVEVISCTSCQKNIAYIMCLNT